MSAHQPSWEFHSWTGSATEFHALDIGYSRAVWLCEVDAPALILGSSQSPSEVDTRMAHSLRIDVVKRRSGGGAVFVAPQQSIWIDITIPRSDSLWVDDVSASMLWLGKAFVRGLAPWVHAQVYDGAFLQGACGKSVCFSSTSPGEVFVGGKKLVGISQRRTRDGARFQCVVYSQWNVEQWLPILAGLSESLVAEVRNLPVATVGATALEVAEALAAQLPQ